MTKARRRPFGSATLRAIVDSPAVRRWAGLGLGACWGLASFATTANVRAQPRDETSAPVEAVIEIEHAPGSELCPDKEAVFHSMRRLFPEREFREGSDTSNSTARARVSIRPLSPGHEAVLTLLPPRHGERVIHDAEDCRGLADALALAFVLLVAPAAPQNSASAANTEASSEPQPPKAAAVTPPAPAEPAKSPQTSEVTPPARRRAASYRAGLGASLVGGLGVLSEPSLGVGAEAELFHRSGWGFSLQGLRLWAQPAEAEGGSVTLSLWGLLIAPCYRQRLGPTSRLDTCLRFGFGSQYADVKGFQSPASGNFPWQVLVPQLSYRQGLPGLGELLSAFVRVGFVGQLRPQSFSVRAADGSEENVPIAAAPKFGVMTELGVMFGTGLF